MKLTTEQILHQGVAAHNAGNLQEAERLYRTVLQSEPAHPDANHNLGVLAVSVDKADAALPLFKLALEANPTIEQFWLSYIDALIKEKHFENAKQVLAQAKKQGLDPDKLIPLEAHLSPKTQKSNTSRVRSLQELLNSLIEHYRNGRFRDAEMLAVEITQEFPKDQFAWKVLGAVLGATGRKSEAVDANQTAVALSPQDAEAHSNLGVTLKDLGRLDEAEASLRQAMALKPDYAEAHNNLGITLKELRRLDEAEASYNQAIALKPDYAEAHSNLGITLQELGRLDEAEASLRQAIALKVDYAEAHSNLGITLKEMGRLDKAEASLRQAIALKPDFILAYNNLSVTLQGLGRLDEAEASLRQAIALKPDYAEAHFYLGLTLKDLRRFDEAEASYTQAIALKRDYAEALYQKSLLLLNRQEFQLGWSLYHPPRNSKFQETPAYYTKRAERWKGSSLQGKNIEVYATQGVGDEIMFSSCIPDLIQESPSKIYLDCDVRLEPLFARSFPEVTVDGRAKIDKSPQTFSDIDILNEDVHIDYSIPIDGLPSFFRNKIEDFPKRDAFLVPDPATVDKWGKRLTDLGEGLKIGISWLGGLPNIRERNSVPLSRWENLLSLDAFFINLQYGDTLAEVAQFRAETNIKIYDWEDNDPLLDLDNQAALISKLDLVISIDNATVQSCIALGTEVWNLVDPLLILRWMENGTGISPLSRHVRFFKKTNPESWSSVLSDAEEELRKKINTQ